MAFAILFISLGFVVIGCLIIVHGLRRKRRLVESETSAILDRTMTIGLGILMMAVGFSFGVQVFL
jgi:hypothetical protein